MQSPVPASPLAVPPTPQPSADAAAPADEVPSVDAVAPRRRPGLSPSRANDFMQCPLLFRFRVVDRRPEPPSSAAARGTLVHSVLERLYDAPLGDRTVELAQGLLPGEWDRLREASPEYGELFTSAAETEAWLDGRLVGPSLMRAR